MRQIIVQGVTTPVREAGSGKPVVFLHGVPDSCALWDGVAEGLKDHYRCIAPDMPGLGASTAPKDFDYSISNRGKWVQDIDMAFPRRLAEHGAKLVSFPDAGHWLPVEKAAEFAANLREFLDS